MRVMFLGDTHGDLDFYFKHALPTARKSDVDVILQVGDFGYFEHFTEVRDDFDRLSEELLNIGIDAYFIQGNHDKISYLMETYGAQNDAAPFVRFRTNLFFVPNGTRWQWAGKKFIALGGAYSIDKAYRLKVESRTGSPESQWFPEEEMADDALDNYLRDTEPVDIMVTHDAPSNADLGVPLRPILESLPNRQRLQKAVRTLKPDLLVHGHFHHRYETFIRNGDGDDYTRVIGLGANQPSPWDIDGYRPEDAWMIVDL